MNQHVPSITRRRMTDLPVFVTFIIVLHLRADGRLAFRLLQLIAAALSLLILGSIVHEPAIRLVLLALWHGCVK